MEERVIEKISNFEQIEENGNLTISYKIYQIDKFEQIYDEENDRLILKPKIPYISDQELSLTSLLHSNIINCYVCDKCTLDGKEELISNKSKYRTILLDIWGSMPTSKILQNTTMNIKLGEHTTKGYVYINKLKFSFQSKDAQGTFKEICKMVSLCKYTLDILIELANGNKIGYKIN